MKKGLLMVVLGSMFLASNVFAADIIITVTIPDAYVSELTAMTTDEWMSEPECALGCSDSQYETQETCEAGVCSDAQYTTQETCQAVVCSDAQYETQETCEANEGTWAARDNTWGARATWAGTPLNIKQCFTKMAIIESIKKQYADYKHGTDQADTKAAFIAAKEAYRDALKASESGEQPEFDVTGQ